MTDDETALRRGGYELLTDARKVIDDRQAELMERYGHHFHPPASPASPRDPAGRYTRIARVEMAWLRDEISSQQKAELLAEIDAPTFTEAIRKLAQGGD